MKVTKFFFGNGVEVLTDNELKNVIGGFGGGGACWRAVCIKGEDEFVYFRPYEESSCDDIWDDCEAAGGQPASCCAVYC